MGDYGKYTRNPSSGWDKSLMVMAMGQQLATNVITEDIAHPRVTINTVLNIDPSRTLTLRKAFEKDAVRRFKFLQRCIKRAIVDLDCFGLSKENPILVLVKAKTAEGIRTWQVGRMQRQAIMTVDEAMKSMAARQFAFRTSAGKVEGFMSWLNEMEERSVLQVIRRPGLRQGTGAWSDMYIQSAYQKGILRGRHELRNAGLKDIPQYSSQEAMSAMFNKPFHAERAGLLMTRTFNELKGITQEMDMAISRVLAQGIAEGRNPRELARILNQQISLPPVKVKLIGEARRTASMQRARTLARTEIIRAHHSANVQEYRDAQIEGVRVKAEWSTAGVGVCPICTSMEGEIFTIDRIETMIPAHPNCRCVALPVVKPPGEKEFLLKGPLIKPKPKKKVFGPGIDEDKYNAWLAWKKGGQSAGDLSKIAGGRYDIDTILGWMREWEKRGVIKKPIVIKPEVVKPKPKRKKRYKLLPKEKILVDDIQRKIQVFQELDFSEKSLKVWYSMSSAARLRAVRKSFRDGYEFMFKDYKSIEEALKFHKVGVAKSYETLKKVENLLTKRIPSTRGKAKKEWERIHSELVSLKKGKTKIEAVGHRNVLEAVERKAYYRYVSYMSDAEVASLRSEILDDLFDLSSFSSGEIKSIMNKAKEGTDWIPFDILDMLKTQGLQIRVKKSLVRGEYFYLNKTITLSSQHSSTTFAHEFAHSIDDLIFSKKVVRKGSKGTGFQWVDNDFITEAEGKRMSDLFAKTHSNVKGTYTNGDGQYWKDNWIRDYEGRIYEGEGAGVGNEWWAVNCERYAGHKIVEKVGYSDWIKAKERYPELTDFIERIFEKKFAGRFY